MPFGSIVFTFTMAITSTANTNGNGHPTSQGRPTVIQMLREADAAETPAPTKKKPVAKMDTAEAILRQKMRASPRNVVRLAAASDATAAVIA